MKALIAGVAGLCLAAPVAFAQDGDATAGAKDFNQCKTCHSIKGADGKDIVRGGQIGPNLFGVVGRKAGSLDGFQYSTLMKDAGDKGLMWNETDFANYVQNPDKFLHDYTGDTSGHAKMTFKLSKAEQAPDIWAYLKSVGPSGG
jgi:cytochrome c